MRGSASLFPPFFFLNDYFPIALPIINNAGLFRKSFYGTSCYARSNESNVGTCQKDTGANLKRFPLAKYGLT